MAPDETRTAEDARREGQRAPAYPPPHQSGSTVKIVNPFHLAIAELQADTDDLDLKPQRPAPTDAPPPRQTIMLTQPVRALGLGSWLGVGAVAMALGLLGGAIATGFQGKQPPPTPPSPDPALVAALDTLKSRTGELGKQMDGLDAKIAALPKPTQPPDLSGLNKKVDQLTKDTNDLKPVDGQVRDLGRKATELSEALATIRADTQKIRGKLEALEGALKVVAARTAPPAPAETTARDDKPKPAITLSQGVDLFKKGRYKEALGTFNKLELLTPDDARVWYFAALSHGFATNHWEGGTSELVLKGIACERAGTPDAASIDAAFKELTAANGKDWLDEYRKLAKERR